MKTPIFKIKDKHYFLQFWLLGGEVCAFHPSTPAGKHVGRHYGIPCSIFLISITLKNGFTLFAGRTRYCLGLKGFKKY